MNKNKTSIHSKTKLLKQTKRAIIALQEKKTNYERELEICKTIREKFVAYLNKQENNIHFYTTQIEYINDALNIINEA